MYPPHFIPQILKHAILKCRCIIVHDRVQNSSGSGLNFRNFSGLGLLRFSSGIRNSLNPVGFSGFTGLRV